MDKHCWEFKSLGQPVPQTYWKQLNSHGLLCLFEWWGEDEWSGWASWEWTARSLQLSSPMSTGESPFYVKGKILLLDPQKHHSASSQRPTAIWVLKGTVQEWALFDPEIHQRPWILRTDLYYLILRNSKYRFCSAPTIGCEDRFGWSLILGNSYALAGGNIHCCTLFLSSWEPCLSRQSWIS